MQFAVRWCRQHKRTPCRTRVSIITDDLHESKTLGIGCSLRAGKKLNGLPLNSRFVLPDCLHLICSRRSMADNPGGMSLMHRRIVAHSSLHDLFGLVGIPGHSFGAMAEQIDLLLGGTGTRRSHVPNRCHNQDGKTTSGLWSHQAWYGPLNELRSVGPDQVVRRSKSWRNHSYPVDGFSSGVQWALAH